MKKWTVMVWIAGDNNLEDFGRSDLDEMKRVGSNADLDLVAQYDRMSDHETRRYYLQRGTSLDADQAGPSLGETNTGDPGVAADFFAWAMRAYPAARYLGVIWNHGSGIDESDIYARMRALGRDVVRKGGPARGRAAVPVRLARAVASRRYRRSLFSTTIDAALRARAIALDDTSRDFLDNVELKSVLARVKRATKRGLDVLGCDACLMNMAEIAFQLRQYVGVLVGSEEVEPGDGWPYDRVLAALAANPDQTPAELGRAIVREYLASYSGDDVTQSALDLGRSTAMGAAVSALADALVAAIAKPAAYAALTKALHNTQSFEIADFMDLYDFCAQVRARMSDAAVKRAAEACQVALAGKDAPFVIASGCKGAGVKGARGVSIYFPRGRDATVAYARLDFAKKTSWDRLIEVYTGS